MSYCGYCNLVQVWGARRDSVNVGLSMNLAAIYRNICHASKQQSLDLFFGCSVNLTMLRSPSQGWIFFIHHHPPNIQRCSYKCIPPLVFHFIWTLIQTDNALVAGSAIQHPLLLLDALSQTPMPLHQTCTDCQTLNSGSLPRSSET